MAKNKLRKKAIELRNKGKTYSEILEVVPVAKSTLSRWLKDVKLARKQKQRITKKKQQGRKRGARRKREIRIEKTQRIKRQASSEIGNLSEREKWLFGIALYWAEGTKPKSHRPSVRVEFANSDPLMVKLYLEWLIDIVRIDPSRIKFGLYIHENKRSEIEKEKKFWSEIIGFPMNSFNYIYFKDHNPKTKRKNQGNEYHGMLRIMVTKSTDLNRKIMGWIEGVVGV